MQQLLLWFAHNKRSPLDHQGLIFVYSASPMTWRVGSGLLVVAVSVALLVAVRRGALPVWPAAVGPEASALALVDPAPGNGASDRRRREAVRRYRALVREAHLTPAQAYQLRVALHDNQINLRATMNELGQPPRAGKDALAQAVEDLHRDTDQRVAGFLTESQFQIYEREFSRTPAIALALPFRE
jgi:hypothetical protein